MSIEESKYESSDQGLNFTGRLNIHTNKHVQFAENVDEMLKSLDTYWKYHPDCGEEPECEDEGEDCEMCNSNIAWGEFEHARHIVEEYLHE